MASIRGPQASGNEDDLTGAKLCRSRQAKTRRLCAGQRKRSRSISVSAGRRTRGGKRCGVR
eukprot:147267-Pleurochrysis_carterae.AAC.2